MRTYALSIALVCTGFCTTRAADLAFKAGEKGVFMFNTGVIKGRLQVTDKTQGLFSLQDAATGVELSKGGPDVGIFNIYRCLSPNKRYGTVGWEWPKKAERLPDGAVRIHWPAADDRPFEMTAVYRWTAADTLDFEIVVKAGQDLPKFELFLSSYMNRNTKGWVYTSPTRHGTARQPEVFSPEVSPLIAGTYLAFPRDLKAAQLFYDGRWELGMSPVQWTVSRYLAAPLGIRQDTVSGLAVAMMSRPQDCFAVCMPYNATPIDGVAGHYSMYLSLFGEDIKAGQAARAQTRLVVLKDFKPADAVERHKRFIEETK